MGLVEQAKLFPTDREVRFSDEELEQSLREVGPQRPAIVWEEEVLDGHRRWALCNKLQIELPCVEAPTRIHAARMLYVVHPRRAFLMFAHEGIRRKDLAYVLGVPVRKIPSAQQLRNARKIAGRGVKCTPEKAVLGGIPMARATLETTKSICAENGISVSALVREMIETVALLGERDLLKRIKSLCDARGISVSDFVYEVLQKGLRDT